MSQSQAHMKRAWLTAVGGVGALVLLVLLGSIVLIARQSRSSSVQAPFTKEIPNVALIDDRGAPFSFLQLTGTPYALFFGYTHCPDTCPITLAKLERAKASLPGDGSSESRIVFVTVDPPRDTPRVLHRYVAQFGSGVIGVTGRPASLRELYKALGIWSVRIGRGPNYEMGHTATIFFVDGSGRVRSLHDWAETPAEFTKAFEEME